MPSTAKSPLDHAVETADDGRAERFAEIERRNGDVAGAKERALTRNARAEDDARRAEKFVEIERRS